MSGENFESGEESPEESKKDEQTEDHDSAMLDLSNTLDTATDHKDSEGNSTVEGRKPEARLLFTWNDIFMPDAGAENKLVPRAKKPRTSDKASRMKDVIHRIPSPDFRVDGMYTERRKIEKIQPSEGSQYSQHLFILP